MKRLLATVVLLVTVLLASACRTTSTYEVSSTPTPDIRVGTRARTWDVRCGDELLGSVALFEDRRRHEDSVYVVRNAWKQDLGLIDALGRAFRYLPHREEPVWVGSGTIAAGAQRIFGVARECELVERGESDADPLPGTAPAAEPERAQPLADPVDAPPSDAGLPQSR